MSYRKSLKEIERKMQYLVGNDMNRHFKNVDKGLSKLEEMKKCVKIMSTRFFRPICYDSTYTYENYIKMCEFNNISRSLVATEEEFNFVREVVTNG